MEAGTTSDQLRGATRDYSRIASTAFGRDQTAITALVVGAGALGNEVIKNLALLGIAHLWIADRDRVEASNLTRSILYCTPDIGTHIEAGEAKATFAAQRVREINPDVDVRPFVGEIADLGYGILRRADVVFSCLDNEMARLEIGWACSRLGRTLVDGGLGLINYSSGQVTVFPGSDGPCYACRKSSQRRSELLRELQGHEDPCWRKDEEVAAAGGVTTTPIMASIIGALQVELGLRALKATDATSLGRAYQMTLHPVPTLQSTAFERSPNCPLHDQRSVVTTVQARPDARSDRWTPRDLLRDLPGSGACVVLDWPVTAGASCPACGHAWQPLVRRARFKAQACPDCGSAHVVETSVVSTINAASPLADRTLSDLGFPAAHIYEVLGGAGEDADRRHIEISGDLDTPTTQAPC